jgi:UDP-glucose 4-epimerase|tara:strand:- start:1 stop:900 length:900 start_codon:yes stop_codon:yes gene_type:complete
MKNLLITGSSGYIGAEIRTKFEKSSWNIFTAGRSQSSQFKIDLNNPASILDVDLGLIQFDVCIHVAAAHEVVCANDPIMGSNINIIGTEAVAQLCINHKIPRFIYISTIHVFGDNTGFLTEDTVPLPNNNYGLSHYLAEEIVLMHNRRDGFNGSIVRLPNVIGAPNDWVSFNRWSLAPFDFCKQISENGSIVLKTHGQQMRNWIDLNSIGPFIFKHVDSQRLPTLHFPGCEFSILELAQKIAMEWQTITDRKVDVKAPKNLTGLGPRKTFSSIHEAECKYPDISTFVQRNKTYLSGEIQ